MAGQKFTKEGRGPVDRWGRDEIKNILDNLGMGPDWFLPLLKEIAERKTAKDRDRLKAVDMIAKFGGFVPPERVFVSSEKDFKLAFGEVESEDE